MEYLVTIGHCLDAVQPVTRDRLSLSDEVIPAGS